MRALVIGSGGREHALAWRLRNSASIRELYASPGNPGISQVAECIAAPRRGRSSEAAPDYVALAEQLRPDLTVVGPEAPLVAGIVDRFRERGFAIVGPTAANAALEGSKIHSKRFMQKLGVPTARFEIAETARAARDALKHFRYPVVLKTDGLAAGKGVIIAQDENEALAAIASLALPLVMEEFLEGEEVSFIVLADGRRAVPLEPSQDHKRVFDGDEGPNTGGMGAYSDSRLLDPAERDRIMEKIIEPVIAATGYTGFLYAGLMMTPDGPGVLEFNVRMGDPETQPLMARLESDWGEALMEAARGALSVERLAWSPEPATCVVLASGGYPGTYETGKPITGLDEARDAIVFHAGTKLEGGHTVTAGGRVLGVTARGENLETSIASAYAACGRISFEGMHYRRDIGQKGLRRYNKEQRRDQIIGARSSVG
ncbi:MAG TPA: phosphoribosylamine--glycine ligase [Bryobacteraceae bacterium]|nr:phosphoribosylamine--glycine ligase [Bryobacteraceae bacterium]